MRRALVRVADVIGPAGSLGGAGGGQALTDGVHAGGGDGQELAGSEAGNAGYFPSAEQIAFQVVLLAEIGDGVDITAGSMYEALVHTHVLKPGLSQPFRVKWPVYEHDLPSSPLKELAVYPQFTKAYQEAH